MITALVVKPLPSHRGQTTRPLGQPEKTLSETSEKSPETSEKSPEKAQSHARPSGRSAPSDEDNEDRFVVGLIIAMAVIVAVPTLMMIAYLILNPESFQYDITP